MTTIRAIVVLLAAVISVPAVGGAPRYERPDRTDRYSSPGRLDLSPRTAAPTLRVWPPDGTPGSIARITGSKFHKHVAAYFGGRRMQILARGDDFLVVRIPQDAWGRHFIYVVGETGQARTDRPFDVGVRYPHRRYGPGYGRYNEGQYRQPRSGEDPYYQPRHESRSPQGPAQIT